MNVYDFDKTIYKNDSTADFYFYSVARHPKMLIYVPSVIGGFFRYYIFKKGTKTEFKEKVMKFVTCIDLKNDVEAFWDKKIGNIKSFYLKQQQDDDVIISASPRFLLEPICNRLGIKHLIASEVDTNDGHFERPNCHSEEKVVRFSELFSKDEVDDFYSDSLSDTPMARLAKNAYLVKGDNIIKWDVNTQNKAVKP